jgi:hypothetical protein
MDNDKTSKQAFGFYRQWEKEFLRAEMKFARGTTKAMLWAYCSAMAVKGTNGIECFASDALIAKELGIYHRETVAKYRHLAIELGWLVRTGHKHGRTEGLSIAVPQGMTQQEAADVLGVSKKTVVRDLDENGQMSKPRPERGGRPRKSPTMQGAQAEPEPPADPWAEVEVIEQEPQCGCANCADGDYDYCIRKLRAEEQQRREEAERYRSGDQSDPWARNPIAPSEGAITR